MPSSTGFHSETEWLLVGLGLALHIRTEEQIQAWPRYTLGSCSSGANHAREEPTGASKVRFTTVSGLGETVQSGVAPHAPRGPGRFRLGTGNMSLKHSMLLTKQQMTFQAKVSAEPKVLANPGGVSLTFTSLKKTCF